MPRFHSGVVLALAATLLSACGGNSASTPSKTGSQTVPAVVAGATSTAPPGSGSVTTTLGKTPSIQSLPMLTSLPNVSGKISFSGLSTSIGNPTNAFVQITSQPSLQSSVPALTLPAGAQNLLFITVYSSAALAFTAPPDFTFNVGSTSGNQYFIAEYSSSAGSWDDPFYTTDISSNGAITDNNPGGLFAIPANGFAVFALYSDPIVQSAQSHVLTADYLGPITANSTVGGSTSISPQQAAASLTWGDVPTQTQAAAKAAGIKTLYGIQPTRQAVGDPLYTSDETTFAHYQNCANPTSADRILYAGTNLYTMSRNAALGTLWKNYVGTVFAGNPYDAVLEVGDGPLSVSSLSPSQLPCNYTTAAAWDALDASMENGLGFPVVDDALSAFQETGNTWSPSPSLADLNASTTGGMEEQCYSSDSSSSVTYLTGSLWAAAENTEISMAQQNKWFFCYPRNVTTASTAQNLRSYVFASFLLTYNPATSILWDIFATPSAYHVEPESTFVGLEPAVAEPSAVSSLNVASGVYAREYRRCYIAGSFVGACAAVVNSDTVPHPYPFGAKYAYAMQLGGGGILDGGTVSLVNTPLSTLAPFSGVVVVSKP